MSTNDTELLEQVEQYIIGLIKQHAPANKGITRKEAVEIAKEHGGVDDETLARIDSLLDRTEASLDELEYRMSRRVGPNSPTGDYHTYPGWGMHITAKRPYKIGTAIVESLTDGMVNFELIEYDGNTGDLVDETEVRIPRGEVPVDIDVDITIPEGEFLLTRDWINPPPEDDRVSLRRQENYAYWAGDSGAGLTFHGSAHDEYSDNMNWYYLFDMGVAPAGGSQ